MLGIDATKVVFNSLVGIVDIDVLVTEIGLKKGNSIGFKDRRLCDIIRERGDKFRKDLYNREILSYEK